MTDGALDFMVHDPQLLRLSVSLGEAVSKWLKHRHPQDAAKSVARLAGVDIRTAENLLAGHLSATTLTRLIRAYGWPFLAQVGAATIGETYENSIERELREIADERRRVEEAERDARARWSRVLARRSVDGGGLRLVAEEPRVFDGKDRRAG
jgi:hypothetical protein